MSQGLFLAKCSVIVITYKCMNNIVCMYIIHNTVYVCMYNILTV